MANIVSSTFTAYPQADGRNTVVELHTDIRGIVHQNVYMAGSGDDLNANLVTHATNLGNDLTNNEIAQNLANAETLGKNAVGLNVTIYSTAAQNTSALIQLWPTLTFTQAIFIGEYLSVLSDATLQAVFGWSPAFEQSIRTNYLTPFAALAASLRSAAGPAVISG